VWFSHSAAGGAASNEWAAGPETISTIALSAIGQCDGARDGLKSSL